MNRYAALLRQSGTGCVRPRCLEGRLPPHTRIISVNRQYPYSRLTGRNLKSVALRVTARVSPPAAIRPNLKSARLTDRPLPDDAWNGCGSARYAIVPVCFSGLLAEARLQVRRSSTRHVH